MTFLGKLFVMINVGVSLMLAFAALALYFNGVDWGYDVSKPGQIGGVAAAKKAEIAEIQQTQAYNETAWKEARPVLWKQEEERRKAREFSVKEIDHNRNKAKEGDPARAVDFENVKGDYRPKPGAAAYLPKMKPVKVRGDKEKADELPDLYSRVYYQAELQTQHQNNLALLDKLAKEFKKDEDYTKQIFDKDAKPEPTGLQPDLMAERVKRQKVEAERRRIKPLYVNTAVESELSLKRLESLKERIRELKAYCAKRGMDAELTKR